MTKVWDWSATEMYSFAFVWAALCVAAFAACVIGIRLVWELSKLALVIGLGACVLLIMGVI